VQGAEGKINVNKTKTVFYFVVEKTNTYIRSEFGTSSSGEENKSRIDNDKMRTQAIRSIFKILTQIRCG
jgi:hypothetical protein